MSGDVNSDIAGSPTERLAFLRAKIGELVDEYAGVLFAPTPFVPGSTVVPPSGKLLGATELRNIVDAGLDAWLTAGRFNDQFETALGELLGTPYVLTVNSGSSANLIAFSALTSPLLGERAINPGDEVITVAASFPTTVNPILQFGAVPVFVDITLPTYNIATDRIEAAISHRTKAVMVAHTLGNPFDVEEVAAICRRHGLWLVEDCCDALGSAVGGQLVGTFGDVATLSFYPAHQITMGEGGAVFTRNPEIKRAAESFRDWGRDCYCAPGCENTCGKRFGWALGDLPFGYDHKYTYSHCGFNVKISDMQAACGVAQLARLPEFVKSRRAHHEMLRDELSACEEVLLLPECMPNASPSWFGFLMSLREGAPVTRLELLMFLDQQKVGTRLLFAGNLVKQPYMKKRTYRVSGDLANTDFAMENAFWVGVHPSLSEEMLRYSAKQIRDYLGFGF